LVRGLDYYSRTVFEWVTDRLGAQGAVCAGGRYDGLVEKLGGRPTPAAGFAIGVERLLALTEEVSGPREQVLADLYIALTGKAAQAKGLLVAETLRDRLPTLRILTHCGGGSVKSQLRKADRSGARFALIIGDGEIEARQVLVKPLREAAPQTQVDEAALGEYLAALFDDKRVEQLP
jgi:histidyl-tRNA synthetase